MTDRTKAASAVLFLVLLLLGVAAWVALTLERGLEGAVVVRDAAVEGNRMERRLWSEDILQGAQFHKPPQEADWGQSHRDLSRLPVGYTHPHGPLGQAFTRYNWFPGMENSWRADARLPASLLGHGALAAALPGQLAALWSEPPIGVVQMKAGAVAAYARPFQIIDFYESNPAIIELSKPKRAEITFTYLADAERRGAWVRVFEGPELETLTRGAPRSFYRILVVETARQGERLAQELITKEALEIYLEVVAKDGVVCFHVSNSERDVVIKVADAANALNLAVALGEDAGAPAKGRYPSDWIMVARRIAPLRELRGTALTPTVRWSPLSPDPEKEGKRRR